MAEYIGNKKFADMKAKDRRYINGNAEEISSLAEKLTSENIEFSGRITEGRCAITIDNEEAYRKALEYIYEIRTQKTQNSIIGNTSFKFFSRNNRYIANEKSEIMNSVRQILDANKIKYSGVVLGDTTKITVYGENKDYLNSLIEEAKNPEVLKQIEKMNFSVEKKTDGTYLIKNDILNTEKEFISLSEIKSDFDNKDAFLFPTAYRIEMLSDAYDDIYGIYAYNPNTSEEYEILSDSDDWILTFGKVDDALDYAESRNITLDNSFIQLKEWRKNDEVALVEENIRKAKEFIDNIDADEDHFVFEEDKIRFTYYNPEGNNEQGQFVEILIFKEDIEEAFRYSFANKNDGFFDYLFTNCSTHLIDAGTEAFIDYAKDFVDKSMSDEPNIYVGNIINDIDGATNRLLEFIDADEIRKEISNDTAEKMELSYELSVFDKIQSEYNQFLEEVKTYDIDKVISMSGELSGKKEIYEYISSMTDFLAEEQYDALINIENTLDAIYNIRIREKCDVRTAIETVANNTLDENDTIKTIKKNEINKTKSLLVNIYGGAGIGKSTSALQIVAELKKMGYSAEYVSEVAKDYIYAKNFEMLNGKYENQSKLMKEQQSKIDLLIGNVDIVITDSPLILSGAYINEDDKTAKKFVSEVISEYQAYNNYDIVLNRDLSVAFETEGRIHTLEQSIQKDAEITKLLNDNDISFRSYERNDINNIVRGIIEEYTVDNILRECFTNKLSVIVRSRNTDDAMKDMSDMVFTDMFNDENYRIEVAKKYIRSGLFIIPNSAFENDAKDKLNELGIDIGGISLASITQTEEGIILESDNISVSYTWNEVADACLEAAQKYNAKELSTDEATFDLYQVYMGEEYRDFQFSSYDELTSMNKFPDIKNYQKVYTGKLSDIHYDNKLEGIFTEFNINHPEDFEGRSASVSDVIVINDKNGEKAYYIDSYGFKEIPDFLIEKEVEVSPMGTEVPEEDSNEEIIDRETIFKSLINAEGIDLVDKLSNMYESEISEACYNKCNEPEVFKQIENKVLELMQNENEPFSNPYYYEGLADEYDAPDEREKISGEIYNCDLLYMTAIADVLELERPKTSADFIYLNDEKVVEEIEDIVENEEKNSHSADEIEIGDKYLYKGREYTVASMKGVYPDDIGISYNEKLSDGRMYAITQNVNKYTLAREGSFIGNEKEPEPTIVEYSERDNISFYDNDYSVNQEVSPMGTEVPEEKKSEKHDFVITDENLGEGGAKTKFKANVEAIKLLNKIEAENRLATPEEQEILSKYVGWGGLAQAFDENNDKWENEFKELKELLSPEEYSNARASTINAFYTSPTVINAIYEGLEKIGFKGGKILEPAMGVGNFFGSMPKEIRDNSSLSGVELDSISGRIAKQLYQNADITVSGYEKTNFADNSFDVVVGNVPFGDYKVYDKDYNKYNFNIHDYFFAKSLDKVHPGGIVAFVTSQGTMDKKSSEIRQYIAERSELLGAIRLPNDAFKSNAGTEVTSDILFLKKRERPIAVDEHSEEWLGRTFIDENIPVNNYFAKNPDMILGTMVQGNKMYGGEKSNSTMCIPKENSSLKEELKKAINNLQGEYVANTKSYEEKSSSDEVVYATPDIKRYSYAIINDELYYRADGNTMKKVEMPKKNEEICKSMIELRKIATELLDLQVHNINYSFEDEITTKRQELNEKYDKFVSNYGLINSKTNAKIFGDDSGYHLLKSLEVKVKDEEKELYKSEYKKADIFTKNTINPISLIEKVDNSNDALLLSLAEKLEVDFEYMSKISDIPEEQLIEELSSSGLIFQNPDNDMKWESADEYLTGNIREKLDIARNSGLEQNIIALEKVLPPDIEAQDISVKLGAYWIPEKYIRDFIIDTFNPNYSTRMNLNVIHEPHSDAWSVEGYNLSYNDVLVNETYGFNDGRNNGYKLIEMALNNQQPKIHKDKLDENGNVVLDAKGKAVRELDTEKTVIIQSKQNALIKKFSEWIMEEPNRRADIVERYNRLFNSVRLREYDGSHLRFVGMSSDVTLYPHQKNAIARALQGGNTLLAHEVGAGKTFEMVAIAMEGKRLGLHNKSLFAVPKHLTEQMGNAFRELYPNCNILVAGEKDFSTQNRKDMIAKIATGDWDAVIVGHSQFDRMRMSPEREKMYIEEELEELRLALEESDNNYGKKSFTVKQIEKTIKKHEAELLKIEERKNSDDFIDFEQLGIDKLFIDESQNYKNLSVPTKMRNVAGLGSSGSNKSLQLLMKCRYLDEITDHKGVIFASGTPISNSMTEMYSLMRYLQNDKLNEKGLTSFDRWANIFGETTTQMELKPTANGEYQMKTRFSKFNNLPELMTMFKECADIKTAATLNLPRPECETHNVVVHPSRIQDMYVKELGKRAEQIHDGNVDAHIDNMLKVTTDGRKIGLDARCINSNAPDDKKSKVNNCINNVFDIWEKTSENKSTQLIFCDMSTPHKPKNENIYLIMRKGSDGEYYSIYSDKLKNSDSPETIFNKLSNNPPKDFVEELGTLLSTDIIVTRTVDMKEEMAYHSISTCSDNKVTAIPEDNPLWKDVHLLPVQSFESEKRFCVYDDIKEKLIAKGVPEKEIAFIHDFEKPEDKQELFEKMNKGEIRIMIGSTSKCGAGMNAQQKMIALHDLDAPMRPSDMGQRRGRIERQGNENSKVDIYRYMTDRTFDAYLYQMLENKQKFISQIMTEKVPVRSCEDIDTMVLEWAEAKALCSGNPLIKEQVDLKARISQLNNLKAEYLSQKYKLQDSIINYPTMKTSAENYIKKIEADIERIVPLTEDEEGKKSASITIDGKEYTDKEEGAIALKEFVEKNRNELFFNNREVKIGEYRGFKISAIASELKSLDTSRSIQICLSGNARHYCDFKLDAEINPIGNITRLNNALSNISEKELPKAKEKLENIESNYIKVQSQVDIPFEHEKELSEKEERLAVVDRELMSGKIVLDKQCVLYQKISEIMPQLIECDDVYEKYDMGDDSGYEPLILEKHDDICILMHSYVQNGDLMYDPAISFSVDREKQTIELISYELSGLSLYQDFTVEGSKDDRDACADFMIDWLDNIDAQGYLDRENSVEIA